MPVLELSMVFCLFVCFLVSCQENLCHYYIKVDTIHPKNSILLILVELQNPCQTFWEHILRLSEVSIKILQMI